MNERTRKYNDIKNRLALSEPFIIMLMLAILQLSNMSAILNKAAEGLSSIRYLTIALYGALFGFVFYIAMFYISFYRTYIVEHRFNLSNQGLSGWIKDEFKRGVISLVIFLIFVELLYFLLDNFGRSWWLIMALGWLFITIAIAKIAPIFIIPLFYKSEPINDDDLKSRLKNLANKFGVAILGVFKLRLSDKTKKANAALVGMGKTRRVLLGDTLLEHYTKDEVEVVLAHELAHHKLKHIWKMMLFSTLITLLAFYLVKLSANALIAFLNLESIRDLRALPGILFILTAFSLLMAPVQNAFSRKLERSADFFALKTTGLPNAFSSCMEKLSKQNLADTSPSRFIEMMLYDHPPISKRIKMAEGFQK